MTAILTWCVVIGLPAAGTYIAGVVVGRRKGNADVRDLLLAHAGDALHIANALEGAARTIRALGGALRDAEALEDLARARRDIRARLVRWIR